MSCPASRTSDAGSKCWANVAREEFAAHFVVGQRRAPQWALIDSHDVLAVGAAGLQHLREVGKMRRASFLCFGRPWRGADALTTSEAMPLTKSAVPLCPVAKPSGRRECRARSECCRAGW